VRHEQPRGHVRELLADAAVAGDVRGAEEAVQHAHAVQHHAGSDAAVDDVLERGLVGLLVGATEAGEHVADERDHLDREIDHQELGRARHQEQPEHQREQQPEKFSEAGVRHLLALGNDEDRQQRRREEEPVEEDAKVVVLQQPAEERRVSPRRHPHRHAGEDDPDHRARHQRPLAIRAVAHEEVLHEHGDGRHDQDRLGPEEAQ
jgi:hypothetical protein